MGRILSIDYGKKRTGLAVTDPLRIIASALTTVETKELEKYLADYFSKNEVDVIVLGKPSQMNGQPSETMRYIEPLAGRLRHAYPDKEVVLYDERFTSVMAHRTMLESGIGKMARRDKALVDRISATIILQSYMDSIQYNADRFSEAFKLKK
ncbi:MAG: Holliday junction resolvase RuvX [Alistipes sp.]|nr:Holliday junction resolvase RuvX [Alistipes sp.]